MDLISALYLRIEGNAVLPVHSSSPDSPAMPMMLLSTTASTAVGYMRGFMQQMNILTKCS